MKLYFSVGSEELGEEFRKENLSEVYNEYLRLKQDDKDFKDKKNYYFVKHEIHEDKIENGIKHNTDYTTEGKVYKRGNKIFFKPI